MLYLIPSLGQDNGQCLLGMLTEQCTTALRTLQQQFTEVLRSFHDQRAEIQAMREEMNSVKRELQSERKKIIELQGNVSDLNDLRSTVESNNRERIKLQNATSVLQEATTKLQVDSSLLNQSSNELHKKSSELAVAVGQLQNFASETNVDSLFSSRNGSCYEEHLAGSRINGVYTFARKVGGSGLPYCTMVSADGGGWREVSDSKVVTVQSRNAKESITFQVSDYGYNPSVYKFEQVVANIEFDGDLDTDVEFVVTFFDDTQIGGELTTDTCSEQFEQLPSWPVTRTVNATTFSLSVQPSSAVDDPSCNANGNLYGDIRFTLIRFREKRF